MLARPSPAAVRSQVVVELTESDPPQGAKSLVPTPDSPRGWEPEELKGPKVTVTGTVVVVEVDGTERDALDGSLSYTVWRDRTGWSRKVPVVKGGFSIEAPEGSRSCYSTRR